MGEMNIYGVYVPMLLVLAAAAYAVLRLIMRLLDQWVEQGWVPMPSVFYLCLYVILLGCLHWLHTAVF
ncbi:DUF1656 domain-containing protein [Acinetobacter sp.]|jgi:hypothetical protein|uniref:DUF1656 domain-containing protein n=1 Tax=Acinetobacter sp. TaxID=472 RepID=UPI0035B0B4B9